MLILGGDFGGTNPRLALFERTDSGLREVKNMRYSGTERDYLRTIIDDFLKKTGRTCLASGFGAPGPVDELADG